MKSKKSSKYALWMNLLPKRPKYANMHGKSINIWSRYVIKHILQSLRSVACLYKNMHLHGNPGSTYNINNHQLK